MSPTHRPAAPRLRHAVLLAPALVPALVVGTAPSAAQTDLTVEAGVSRVGATMGSTDVPGSDARFLLAGLRAGHQSLGGSGVFGSVLIGRSMGSGTASRFASGLLEGRVAGQWTPSLELGLEARLMGFEAETPYPHRALALEGGPTLQWRAPMASVKLAGMVGAGDSELTLWREIDGPRRTFRNELRRAGGTAEILLGPAATRFGMVGGWHDTPRGTFHSVGARAVLAGAWGVVELRADRWTTPLETEIVAGLALVLPVGASWSVRGFFGRTEPDPLTLARPGTTGGGALVGRSLLPAADPDGSSVYDVVGSNGAAQRVRFSVTAPEADDVRLVGDFSVWEPIPMRRDGDRWSVEIDVPEGVHHFGFLVDDAWYLPDDAPDVVPDEWGRESATLVIEGASR